MARPASAMPIVVVAHAPPVERTSLALVLAATTIGLILVVVFVVPQPVWSGQPSSPRDAGSPAASGLGFPGALLALGFGLALTLPYRPYALALRVLERAAPARLVMALTAALAGLALLIYPAYGSDIFAYIANARLSAVYGEHPLLAVLALHPADWAYPFVWASPFVALPYGPLWAALTWPMALLGGTSAAFLVLEYKLLSLAGYVASCWLIWSTVPPAQRVRALVVFAWSPLVLFETLGKVHNDVLLAVTALAAVRLLDARGMVAATLGGLIKLSGLAVVPALAAELVRTRRWRALAGGALGAAGAVVAAYAPVWQGPETLLPVLAQTNRVVWSPGSLLIAAGMDSTLVRIVLATLWVVACVAIVARVRQVAASAALLLLATLLLLTTAFFAHYLVPVVALAAVAGERRLHTLALGLSIGSLAAYATELLSVAMPDGWIGSGGYQVLGSLLTLAPAALLLGKQAMRG
jgi:hypothetical protein